MMLVGHLACGRSARCSAWKRWCRRAGRPASRGGVSAAHGSSALLAASPAPRCVLTDRLASSQRRWHRCLVSLCASRPDWCPATQAAAGSSSLWLFLRTPGASERSPRHAPSTTLSGQPSPESARWPAAAAALWSCRSRRAHHFGAGGGSLTEIAHGVAHGGGWLFAKRHSALGACDAVLLSSTALVRACAQPVCVSGEISAADSLRRREQYAFAALDGESGTKFACGYPHVDAPIKSVDEWLRISSRARKASGRCCQSQTAARAQAARVAVYRSRRRPSERLDRLDKQQ